MKKAWIIIANEGTGDHISYMEGGIPSYLNGPPERVMEGNPPFREEDLLPHMITKKRIIIINKTRYVVVARGESYEP